jgi:predicted dehydrogenase
MAKGLGWGILGTGGIARAFTRDIQGAGLRVVAAGSRSADKAEAFASELGVGRAHGSYAELCADPAVDIVYVATPHPMHHPDALLALRAGKHVLVEKPFTLNAREARELVAEAGRHGLFLMEAMWTRFLPTMAALRDSIDRGILGDIVALQADHDQALPFERAPRLHLPELGGGALLDLGVYPLSFAHFLFGKPARLHAAANLTERGVDAQISLALAWEAGRSASLHAGMLAAGANRAVILGTAARLELDPVWYAQTSYSVIAPDGRLLERYEGGTEGRGMQHQALEAERLVAAGRTESPLMRQRDSVEIMEIMDEARRQVGLSYPGE